VIAASCSPLAPLYRVEISCAISRAAWKPSLSGWYAAHWSADPGDVSLRLISAIAASAAPAMMITVM